MDCPGCSSSHTAVIESRLCTTNGTRRRRHSCQDCGHRWTSWEGDKPPPGNTGSTHTNRRKPARNGRAKLTPEQVKQALTRLDLNNTQLGQELGCSRETIRQVRAGLVYRNDHPELLRPNEDRRSRPPMDGPTCLECAHWKSSRCSFDFPDPLLEGITFAADCDLYEVSQSISRACPTSVQ
jgi:hypothetical protein